MIQIRNKLYPDEILDVYAVAYGNSGNYHILIKDRYDPEYSTGGIPRTKELGWDIEYLDENIPTHTTYLKGFIWNMYGSTNPLADQIECKNMASIWKCKQDFISE